MKFESYVIILVYFVSRYYTVKWRAVRLLPVSAPQNSYLAPSYPTHFMYIHARAAISLQLCTRFQKSMAPPVRFQGQGMGIGVGRFYPPHNPLGSPCDNW